MSATLICEAPLRAINLPADDWGLVSVPQRDLPEQQHHADTETRLLLAAQPGADVSDTSPPSACHTHAAEWKAKFIKATSAAFTRHSQK